MEISDIEKLLADTVGGTKSDVNAWFALRAAAPSLAAELLELKLRDRWIPCEEKKPLMGELVSLWLPYGAMHQGYFGCDGKFHLCISGRIADEAIAWHPLPSPPIATQVAGQGPSNAVTT